MTQETYCGLKDRWCSKWALALAGENICFLVISFHGRQTEKERIKETIREVLTENNVTLLLAEEVEKYGGDITCNICREISNANIIICDLTRLDRPNLPFELGLARHKPIIIMIDKRHLSVGEFQKLFSDLPSVQLLTYKSAEELETKLSKRVDAILEMVGFGLLTEPKRRELMKRVADYIEIGTKTLRGLNTDDFESPLERLSMAPKEFLIPIYCSLSLLSQFYLSSRPMTHKDEEEVGKLLRISSDHIKSIDWSKANDAFTIANMIFGYFSIPPRLREDDLILSLKKGLLRLRSLQISDRDKVDKGGFRRDSICDGQTTAVATNCLIEGIASIEGIEPDLRDNIHNGIFWLIQHEKDGRSWWASSGGTKTEMLESAFPRSSSSAISMTLATLSRFRGMFGEEGRESIGIDQVIKRGINLLKRSKAGGGWSEYCERGRSPEVVPTGKALSVLMMSENPFSRPIVDATEWLTGQTEVDRWYARLPANFGYYLDDVFGTSHALIALRLWSEKVRIVNGKGNSLSKRTAYPPL